MSQAKPHHFSTHRRGLALVWLFFTLMMLVLTVLLWMFSAAPNMSHAISNEPIEDNDKLGKSGTTIQQLTMFDKLDELNELSNDVQPINHHNVIYDLRDYPSEFQDKAYLNKHKNKWTVQVMNVAENEIITDYLKGREDRQKFAYFRFLDTNNQPRYMLTYGLMNSVQEAMGATKLVNFGLPRNVRVIPEQISRYIGIIDDYEKMQPLVDLDHSHHREVNLQATSKEVPANPQSTQETPSQQDGGDEVTANDTAQSSNLTQNGVSNRHQTSSIRSSDDKSDTLSINETRMVADDDLSPANRATKNHANVVDNPKANQGKSANVAGNVNVPKPKPFDPNQFPNQKIVGDDDMP